MLANFAKVFDNQFGVVNGPLALKCPSATNILIGMGKCRMDAS